MKKYKVIIIGGGAAGMLAAINAKCGGVAVVEAQSRVGKKLLATGNGKCNLLNKNLSADYYNNPSFVAPAFEKYDLKALEDTYKGLGLELRFDEEGRGYPLSESAATVLDVLRRAMSKKGVELLTETTAESITKNQNGFNIKTDKGELLTEKVVFAVGSDAGFGLDSLNVVKQLADVTAFRPSLAPVATETDVIKGLNGVRVKCGISLIAGGKTLGTERGEILFKTFGLSGIAVFNLSALYARSGAPKDTYFSLNLLDETAENARKKFVARLNLNCDTAEEFLCGVFHKMLAAAVLNYAGVAATEKPTKAVAERLATAATDFQIKLIKTCDKSLAQVMCGGVNTDGVNKNTLESKSVKGLYFAGEALDVDGVSGGYNLMWAAASALLVAESLI